MLTHERLIAMADGLVQVSGIVGVMLGGSRARDDLAPDSDYDLGLLPGPKGGQPRRSGRCCRAVGRRRQSELPTVTGYPGRPSKLTAFFSSR